MISMEQAILDGVKVRIRQIIEEESAAASKRVADRVRAEADGMVMRLMRHFEVQNCGDRVIIEVRKNV